MESKVLYLVSEDMLIELVERLDAKRAEREQASKKADSEKLLTKKEVAQMLQCSETKLWRMAKDGILPAIHIGGGKSVRYKMSDVLKLTNHDNKTIQ